MSSNAPIDPATALNQLFQVVREEALANPRFARRLLDSVGCTVIFRGDEALAAVDPLLVAMHGHEEFRRTFVSMTVANVKRVGKSAGLFSQAEALPGNLGTLVELLWDRSIQQVNDRFPVRRVAAE